MSSLARGRPRVQETADGIVAAELAAAGARVSTDAYTTRQIAHRTGLSQTVVSRAVRRIRHGDSGSGPTPAVDASLAGRLQLVQFRVQYPVIILRFEITATTERPTPRAAERRAAAVMASLRASGAEHWPAPEQFGAAEGLALEPADGREPSHAGGDEPSPRQAVSGTGTTRAPAALHPSAGCPLRAEWIQGRGSWDSFLSQVSTLLNHCRQDMDAIPGELLQLLAVRASSRLHGISWRYDRSPAATSAKYAAAPGAALTDQRVHGERAPRPAPETTLSRTEQVAIALRAEMVSSGYRPGDRLSVHEMADRLGLAEATVRNAMRALADDGLLDHSGASFWIPHLSSADVIDLYASRLHVGTLILRACAHQPRSRLVRAKLALGVLDAAVEQGSRTDAGEADLRFQQELADASGLQHSARIFRALTLRLRFFISVLQLDYSPAVSRLVFDDRRLLRALADGQADGAVRIWRSKLEDAARYMASQAPTSAFDGQLWSRLTVS